MHHLRHSKLGAAEDACLPGGFARESRRSKPRVDEFVDPEVEKRKAGTEERDAKARRRPPPPPPAADGVVGESLAQHVAPIPQPWRRGGGRTREAEEGDRDIGSDRGERREEKRGGDDRNEVGQDLDENDPEASLTRNPGRLDKIPVAQRQRLRPQGAG